MKPELIENFFYWINERHSIYIKYKVNKEPWPWTDDPILREYKFTNVLRELDSGTVWLRENWLKPYAAHTSLFFNICLYRQFNRIETAQRLGFTENWNPVEAEARLREFRRAGVSLFTSAHMVWSARGLDKIAHSVWIVLNPIWLNRKEWAPKSGETLESAFCRLREVVTGFGDFVSYEVVTDLRHTRYLENAPDIMTWANAGPGAIRGIKRLHGWQPGQKLNFKPEQYTEFMRQLLAMSPTYLAANVPPLEMRDVEHSLCEWDKYQRAFHGQGRPRVRFTPPHLRRGR